MPELLTGNTDEFFSGILRENLREPRPTNVAVLTIGGLPGSGVTSTCSEIAETVQKETNIPVISFSSSDEAHRITRELTGNRQANILRDPQSVRSVDKSLATLVLSPSAERSLIIADGRLAPFAAKALTQAGRSYPIPLPFHSLGILLYAEPDTRYSRKYLAARRTGRIVSYDNYHADMENQEKAELEAFWHAYPNLDGANPNSMSFQLNGEDVYDLRWNTDRYTAREIADKIITSAKVVDLLQITQ